MPRDLRNDFLIVMNVRKKNLNCHVNEELKRNNPREIDPVVARVRKKNGPFLQSPVFVCASRNESRYRLSMTAYFFFACKWTQRLYSLTESSYPRPLPRINFAFTEVGNAGRGTEIDRLRGARQTGRKHNVRKETSGAVPFPTLPPSPLATT